MEEEKNTTRVTVDEVGGYITLENNGDTSTWNISKDVPGISFYPQDNCAGGYRLGSKTGIEFQVAKKPSWIARTMTRILLQWYWCDNK